MLDIEVHINAILWWYFINCTCNNTKCVVPFSLSPCPSDDSILQECWHPLLQVSAEVAGRWLSDASQWTGESQAYNHHWIWAHRNLYCKSTLIDTSSKHLLYVADYKHIVIDHTNPNWHRWQFYKWCCSCSITRTVTIIYIREGCVYPSYKGKYMYSCLKYVYTHSTYYIRTYVYNVHNSTIAIVNYKIMSYPRWPWSGYKRQHT